MAISKIGSKALVDCSVASADLEDGSITNAKLANSSITINGTSVSLGASASLKDISWQSVVTADGSTATSAVAGNGYFIDTTSAAHTINLPSSPSAGDKIAIKDYAGTFGTNNLTIGRNGNNIQGVANDSLISTNRASIILVYSDATKGWLYTVESNVADLGSPSFIAATGGTITTTGNYKIHTFTGDGCFVVSSAATGPAPNNVDYLVVAGGGGGAGSDNEVKGGGGGAGGFRMSNSTSMPAPTTSPLASPTGITITASTYPITVGAGGSGAPGTPPANNQVGTNGSNSIFSTITSAGGGYGGSFNNGGANTGGSGGGGGTGASAPLSPGAAGNTPPVSPPQGNPGGTGNTYGSAPSIGLESAGGGGGAGAAGTTAPNPADGSLTPGGDGSYVSPTMAGCNGTPGPVGSTRYFAGGGGGGQAGCSSPGGAGGGGVGGNSSLPTAGGTAGSANTGGGGGGAGAVPISTNQPGSAGGKGIVIIRYKYQ